MKDYFNVIPEDVYLLRKHFTRGREGNKPQFLTRHHLMYIGNGRQVVDRIWNARPASAHLVTDQHGRTCQTVWDRDTAWGNANWWANLRTIVLEHSNNTGRNGGDFAPGSLNISDATLIEGARIGAAYCRFYGWGRPHYGTNIRDHFEFTSTGCPVHLQGPKRGNAWGGQPGKYHFQWMEEASWFYDQMQSGLVDAQGNPIKRNFPAPTPKKETITLAEVTRAEFDELLTKTRELHNALLAPVPSTVEGSTYKAPRVAFMDHMDRKIEDLHVALKSEQTPTQKEADAFQKASDNHDEKEEDTHNHA
ncbi:peptidoglycan recognition protein family protein [Corynebacterium cystitidis]|uniref:peptidoglycan recognition protein family protein n=1 Tax=Corynebacterium cystitidis TaxID=35757 RepID=UPI00211E5EFA|nr:N-acetylmuramoyl-L-alanine amidase [Corynebacterium cystitidis]